MAKRYYLSGNGITRKAAKAITDILNTYGLPAKARDLSRLETMP